mmetsp:Transcript_36547/g.105282  ORF Transcript_36547/g.105282 Transcript_36547/m.105282 type:complete len:217 (+) Transcript_36547:1422-2072(+)
MPRAGVLLEIRRGVPESAGPGAGWIGAPVHLQACRVAEPRGAHVCGQLLGVAHLRARQERPGAGGAEVRCGVHAAEPPASRGPDLANDRVHERHRDERILDADCGADLHLFEAARRRGGLGDAQTSGHDLGGGLREPLEPDVQPQLVRSDRVHREGLRADAARRGGERAFAQPRADLGTKCGRLLAIHVPDLGLALGRQPEREADVSGFIRSPVDR